MTDGQLPDANDHHVVIVQCTASKRDQPAPARDIYDESTYYRKQRAYAESVADHWYIQSAKHGLLSPEVVIEPYNTHAKDVDAPEKWAEEIATDLAAVTPAKSTVELLGGMAYADPLTPELEARGFDVLEPLRGLGIGERMAELDTMQNSRLEVFA